jgi:branched-chain amino acid transport system ATP-binding protein
VDGAARPPRNKKAMSETALELGDVSAWYGRSQALHDVNLTVRRGEVITIAGRNGSGRTTLFKTILRMMPRQAGRVSVFGVDVHAMRTPQVAKLGIGYCPEERAIFKTLTCDENLALVPKLGDRPGFSVDELYEIFPNLHARRRAKGGTLSGGEQQMLALARILRAGAELFLLDEISEGLAPIIVEKLREVVSLLRERRATVLLAEQNFEFAKELSDRLCFMDHGQIVESIPASEIDSRPDLVQRFLTL